MPDKGNRPAEAYYLNTKKSPNGTPQMGCNSPCPNLTTLK